MMREFLRRTTGRVLPQGSEVYYSSRFWAGVQRLTARRKRFPLESASVFASTIESMEARLLLASISGISYIDLNGDGVRQGNEPPLVGATVYLDANHNQRFDADEASAT